MKEWDDIEIEFLENNWENLSDEEIGSILNRSNKGVFMKRQRRGLVDKDKQYMQGEEYKKIMSESIKKMFKKRPELRENLSRKLRDYHHKHPEILKKGHFKIGQTAGKKHWNWKGGINDYRDTIRRSAKYLKWRKNVFERDNFTCQICYSFVGDKNAHHIIPFSECLILGIKEEIFNLDNGITLCCGCHHEIHKKNKD